MQGNIGQAAGLTIFGNDLLAGTAREGFWPVSSVFTFSKSVEFTNASPSDVTGRGSFLAPDPPSWIAKLRSDGVRRLELHYRHSSAGEKEDRMMTGFVGGGGQWLIETARNRDSDFWQGVSRLRDKDDPKKQIWADTYYQIASHVPHSGEKNGALDALSSQFEAILIRIIDLAHRAHIDWAEKSFLTARSLLHSNAPLLKGYYSDAFDSPRLGLPAKRLLGAAQLAWVFGGMGSWNDIYVEDKDRAEYENLSRALFDVLTRAIVAAANASANASQ